MGFSTLPETLLIREKHIPLVSGTGKVVAPGAAGAGYVPSWHGQKQELQHTDYERDNAGYAPLSLTRWLKIEPNMTPQNSMGTESYSLSIVCQNDHAHMDPAGRHLSSMEKLALRIAQVCLFYRKAQLETASLQPDKDANERFAMLAQEKGVNLSVVKFSQLTLLAGLAVRTLDFEVRAKMLISRSHHGTQDYNP